MSSAFLLYGATGFVGNAIARLAVGYDLAPILAGRNDVFTAYYTRISDAGSGIRR